MRLEYLLPRQDGESEKKTLFYALSQLDATHIFTVRTQEKGVCGIVAAVYRLEDSIILYVSDGKRYGVAKLVIDCFDKCAEDQAYKTLWKIADEVRTIDPDLDIDDKRSKLTKGVNLNLPNSCILSYCN